MGALVRGFHLPLPIDLQGLCMYVAYYFMLSVLLFGVGAPVLLFGMGALVLPYYRCFCILFFFFLVLLFGEGAPVLIVV